MIGVPIGSTLVRVVYEVPTLYGCGERFTSRDDAIRASLDEWARVESDLTINAPGVTERWQMRAPDGMGADVPVETTTIAPHMTVGVVGTEERRKVRARLAQMLGHTSTAA